jgi:hypothetical protein
LALANLFSTDPAVRVFGSDRDESWTGQDHFLAIFETQSTEMPDWELEIQAVEAFQDGPFGWAMVTGTLMTSSKATPLRNTGVFRLETGIWRVIQWRNSIPGANAEVFGVELTQTRDELVTAVVDDAEPLQPGHEGTMSLVSTDIVESTRLAESVGDTRWTDLVRSHERRIREITGARGGTVVKFLGRWFDAGLRVGEGGGASCHRDRVVDGGCPVLRSFGHPHG